MNFMCLYNTIFSLFSRELYDLIEMAFRTEAIYPFRVADYGTFQEEIVLFGVEAHIRQLTSFL